MAEVRIATRRSSLAVAQAEKVAELLMARHPGLSVHLVEVITEGDRDTTGAIAELTETGAFVNAVQKAVLDGQADLAVHSLKDLPVDDRDGLVAVAFPERASPFDVLVGGKLDELRPGSIVGTGSPRRAAQLRALRPDLTTVDLRGNVDTRVRKVSQGEVGGAVLAEAGLERLGLSDRIGQRFRVEEMVPAAGQGALVVEARPGTEAAAIAATIDDRGLRVLLETERDLLAQTNAGCRSALGALATWSNEKIRMDLFVDDDKGSRATSVVAGSGEELVAGARRELGL